jgi:hypothetical protein
MKYIKYLAAAILLSSAAMAQADVKINVEIEYTDIKANNPKALLD